MRDVGRHIFRVIPIYIYVDMHDISVVADKDGRKTQFGESDLPCF